MPLSGVGTESSQNDNDDSGQSEFGDLTSNSGIAGLANDNNNAAAHKVKFSTKGLNAQQLQLIEKLLKEKKCTPGSKSHPVSATTSPVTTTSGGASLSAIAEGNAAAALASVQSPPKGPVKPPQQVWSFTRIKQVWPLAQFFSVSFL